MFEENISQNYVNHLKEVNRLTPPSLASGFTYSGDEAPLVNPKKNLSRNKISKRNKKNEPR
jgi:hypothetical protein